MIEVHIQTKHLDAKKHETLVGRLIIESGRAAGIPVLGEFALVGVKHGAMTFYNEIKDGIHTHVLRWRENEDDRETNFQRTAQLKHGPAVYSSGKHLVADDEL